MSQHDLTTTFSVDQTPDEVFAAITNVRAWWTGDVEGKTAKVGDEFVYRYKAKHRSTQKVTEAVPGKKIVWKVVDANLPFAKDPAEWVGTEIHFDIARKGDKTEVRFTHVGLVPEYDCFDACSNAWTHLVSESLRSLITDQRKPTRTLDT
jgi:uncharacterized protein YndB with AHSA1/START domain